MGWKLFITINTKYGENYFGEVKNKRMIKNEIGEIVEKYWWEITEHFSNVDLDEFIVMPNHIHGIITIKKIEILDSNNIPKSKESHYSIISPKAKSLAVIIRSYKSACTRTINMSQNKVFFKWHSKFYDSLIRTEKDFQNVKNYIMNNPLNY